MKCFQQYVFYAMILICEPTILITTWHWILGFPTLNHWQFYCDNPEHFLKFLAESKVRSKKKDHQLEILENFAKGTQALGGSSKSSELFVYQCLFS